MSKQPLLPSLADVKGHTLSEFLKHLETAGWYERYKRQAAMQGDIVVIAHIIDRLKFYTECLSQEKAFAQMWNIFFKMVKELADIQLSFPFLEMIATELNMEFATPELTTKFDAQWLMALPGPVKPVLDKWSLRGAQGRHLFDCGNENHDKETFGKLLDKMAESEYTAAWAGFIRSQVRKGDAMARMWQHLRHAATFGEREVVFARVAAQPHDEEQSEHLAVFTARVLTKMVQVRALMSQQVADALAMQGKILAGAMSAAITGGQLAVSLIMKSLNGDQ